ncbi:hypothetical protein M7775_15410 [Sporomusa sphaeroides DSM 2875]|uniref:hypothetical protein n=1 Tax=Sporomusa sphaeroides TaxID=47679 RepID=UPI00202F0E7C|nr:hypothetical protein [Sporomusa sphaeroides]MCM0759945.1 hypothetical protein [Sporomusa sphaeroides DSM 2875]
MARIQLTISAENAQAIAALKQVAEAAKQTGASVKNAGSGNGFAGATQSAGGFLDKLSKVTIVGAGIVAVLREVKDATVALLGPGFEFHKNMETNKLGMAGILQSMTLIDGKAVDFNQALAISSDMMKKLQMDALRTAASTEDLAEVFRAILAPGINAGMSLEQIRQLTTVGTNAIKSLGIPRQQIVQEMRDLVQGGITAAGSTLATALGITDSDIKKAKDSSEGLFKFLMDRMEGFKETSNKFPDTLAGKLDQLTEMWAMASAKFTEEFEDPIKDGLQSVTDLMGTVNAETGQFDVNPDILDAIDEIKDGLREIKVFAADIAPSFAWVKEDVLPGLKDTWRALKNISSVIGDSLRMSLQTAQPFLEFFGQGFRDLAHDVAEVTGLLKELYDWMARKSGAKKPGENKSWSEFKQREDTSTLPSVTGDMTAKYPNAAKAVKDSQSALKIALSAIAADAKIAVAAIKKELEKLEVSYKQSMISFEEYARRKTELEMKVQQEAVKEAQRKLEAIQGAKYDKDSEKKNAVDKANNEFSVETEKLKDFGASLDDVNKAIGAMSGASNSWRKEVENVNIDGLQDNAKSAIDALAAYFYEQTGRQMVVSSGLRTWESHPKGPGGHISGTKFDVVDAGDSRLLEDNVSGIRDKLIAYARNLGLKILDAYAGDEGPEAPGHLDFNAKDFNMTLAAQAKAKIGTVSEKSGLEYLNLVLELMGEADEISKSLAEAKGDVSTRQKAELAAKYNDLIKRFEVNEMADAVKDVQDLQKVQFAKLDFDQAQKDLEIANEEMVTIQIDLLNSLATGAKSASEVSDEYVKLYDAKTKDILAELRRQLADAGNDRELANKIRAAIRGIADKLSEFFDAVIARIDAELQHELAMIDADSSLTNMQRQDKIDEAKRRAAARKAIEYENQAQKLREIDEVNKNNSNAATITKLEQAAALNRELAKMPSLLGDVNQAAKQGLEDGLLDFLERGILECRNLGDAFRNLAITVLQSINRMYAEALTKNIMNALFPNRTSTSSSGNFSWTLPNSILIPGKAEGGSLMDSGEVKGPGTSTSDDILAWIDNAKRWIRISNGEFVMRGQAVAKYGQAFLERLNSGQVPVSMLQRYAVGGSLTNRNAADIPGAQELSASLVNNNSTTIPLSIMNILDPGIMGKYLQTREGKKALLNYIKDDASTIRQVLSIRG